MDEDYKNNLYRLVAEEMSSNKVDQGLWLRALVESNNDHEAAKACYAQLRVEELFRGTISSSKAEIERKRELKRALKKAEENQKRQPNKFGV